MAETTDQYKSRISQIKTSIENEPEIVKMREDIAEGISKTGNRQADIEVRQGTLEEDFVKVQQDASSVSPSGAEVAVARGEYSTLDGRLTAEQNKVNAQLAHKAEQTDLEVEKERIDNLISLPDGSTTNDARLEDITIGADGEVYDSPGNAVRQQVSGKQNKDIAVNPLLNFEVGAYSLSGVKETVENRVRVSVALDVKAGDYIVNKNRDLYKYAVIEKGTGKILVNLNSSSTGYKFLNDTSIYMYMGYVSNEPITNIYDVVDNIIIYSFNALYELNKNVIQTEYTGTASDEINPYSKIKWGIIGDSLSDPNNSYATTRYYDVIAENLGVSRENIQNLAVSGSGYKRTNSNFVVRASELNTNLNVVTVFGSFNDVNPSVNYPYGTAEDRGTETLGGSMNTLIDTIKARCPYANIGIIAPPAWSIYPTSEVEGRGSQYIDLMRAVCERRGVHFLNLYHSSGLEPTNQLDNKFFYENNVEGNVHPNTDGHKLRLAPPIREFIKTLA